jgi:hypothetical protein
LLHQVITWAQSQPTITGVALVGSHARGTARPDSDVDLVLLCTSPQTLVDEPTWTQLFGAVRTCQTENWGVLTSLRVYYRHGLEVEFGLTTPQWAAIPVDAGTQRVVADGMRLLWDPQGVLEQLWQAVSQSLA